MKASALLKLHQRQVDLLDMVVKCNNRIHSKEVDLRFIQSCTDQKDKWWYEFTKAEENCKMWIERTQAIRERLKRYYLDIEKRIKSLQPELMDLVTQKS